MDRFAGGPGDSLVLLMVLVSLRIVGGPYGSRSSLY